MNKKLTILLVLVVAILAIVISSVVFAQGGPSQPVTLCHFNGHEADDGTGDFFAGMPSRQQDCANLGGNLLSVSLSAGCKGHGARAPLCATL